MLVPLSSLCLTDVPHLSAAKSYDSISCTEKARRYQFTEPHLGTLVSLTCYHTDSLAMAQIADSVFTLLEELNLIFSDYDDRSEVVSLNEKRHRGAVAISPELARLLIIAEQISMETRGAFDPYLGRLTHLWKKAFHRDRWPGKRAVRRALRRSGHAHLGLSTDQGHLVYQRRCIEIDLGGIGKGYIGDRLSAFLNSRGLSQHLIDLGGDLIAGDPPPGTKGWNITLPSGEQILLSRNAVATSGTTYQYLEHKGRTYSHLIDPGTGYGLGGKVTSTVVARSGAEADALASALPFLSEELLEDIFENGPNEYMLLH